MHLYSLCQTWLILETHTVSETSCLTTVSQTITVSSCQSDNSNQCRACITGMARSSTGRGGCCMVRCETLPAMKRLLIEAAARAVRDAGGPQKNDGDK